MSQESSTFEKAGLHIDRERVLTYSKLSCPFDCKYCFVDDLDNDQQKSVAYLSQEQIELIKQLPPEISLIMLGCDTEFFQSADNSLSILEKLSQENRDVSVITKLALPFEFIDKINQIRLTMLANGNILSFSISLPCLESAQFWEPRAPIPSKRIESLKYAFGCGFVSFVALRPLLPTLDNNEIAQIVDQTYKYCNGYYSGPLYMKNLDETILPADILSSLSIQKVNPHWMPEGSEFYKIEKPGQMEYLRMMIESKGTKLFEGAAEAIGSIKEKNEKY